MIIGNIKNGIVIDHIPAGRGMELYRYLRLDDLDYDLLGYIDPGITVNTIRDGKRVEKVHPSLPETITNVIRCKNPRCISATERDLPHVFRLSDRERGVYRCIYCDTRASK